MRNAGAYAIIVSPEPAKVKFDNFRCEQIAEGVTEMDAFVCIHCNRSMHVKPKAPMDEFGSMCRNCMKMVCPACANGPCVPFMKKLDLMEKRDRALRSYGI